jgi:GcrA cell cycle regulator
MGSTSTNFDWNDDTIRRLRALWAEGHSTAEIGRRMGVSKNAIVGKAHRLDLDSRPSPIRAKGTSHPRRRMRPACPPLPALPSLAGPPPTVATPAPRIRTPPRAPISTPRLGTTPCCWPIGDPGTASFHFCKATSVLGKPYCPEHCARAYITPNRRRRPLAA